MAMAISPAPSVRGHIASVQEVEVRGSEPVAISGVGLADIDQEDLAQLTRLVDILPGSSESELLVRRNRHHRVGRVVIGNITVSVLPELEAEDFLTLVLYASGEDVARFLRRVPATIDLHERSISRFLSLFAALLVEQAELILQRHLAQVYIARTERLYAIRGRIQFGRDFGRHPAQGISCAHYLQETDNDLNRLVFAGLIAARGYLPGTPYESRCQTQIFIWQSLVSRPEMTYLRLIRVQLKLNRQVAHYGPALVSVRTLLFGWAPEDLFSSGVASMQTLEFSMAILFELFVGRVLADGVRSLGLSAAIQQGQGKAMVDARGSLYRRVRPDFVLYRGRRPVAVLDAKYKPRYLWGGPGGAVPVHNRVSNEDLYQLFFYQARLRNRFRVESPIRSAIVAPDLTPGEELAEPERRLIYWSAGEHGAENERYGVQVVALPVPTVLSAIRSGGGPGELLAAAPELLSFLEAL